MDKIYRKRTNILDIVDRLHVEKTIFADTEEKRKVDEDPLKNVVNPILLDNPKQNVLTVEPGINGKVKRRVYMLRRSRTTEGGSLVCELCGHLSFKLYSTAIEITEEGKRASQWRRTQTEVVKVCRTCYTEHTGCQTGSNKTGRKNKGRPAFERSTFGVTEGRASNSWHFLRRDVAKSKTKLLMKKECFETEFAETYLSEESSETNSFNSSEDEETCYEESENDENSSHILPFQLDINMLGTPDSLEKIHRNKTPENISPVPSMKDGVTLDMLLENELAITRTNSEQLPSYPSSPDTLCPSEKCGNDQKIKVNSEIFSSLLNNHEKPIALIREGNLDVSDKTNYSETFMNTALNDGLFDYFTKTPGRFRKIKVHILQKKNPKIAIKRENFKNLRRNRYAGVCRLVTVLNQKKGHYIDNSSSSCLYDVNGVQWRKQDLPSFIGINTSKFVHGKPNYRQRKKEVDSFLTTSKPRMIVKYKSAVEVEEENSDTQSENTDLLTHVKQVSSEPTNEVEKSSAVKLPDLPPGKNEENSMNNEKSLVVLMEPINEKLQEKIECKPIVKKKEEKGPTTGVPRGKSNHQCAVCGIALFKSYNVFNKDSAPLMLLKYFKEKSTIRVCRSCLSVKNGFRKSSPNEKGKKRARSLNELTVPAKVLKPSQQEMSTPTPTKEKSKTKSPPKKSQKQSEQDQSKILTTKKSDDLTKVLHKHLSEKEKTPTKTKLKKNNRSPKQQTASTNKHSKLNVNVLRNPDVEQLKKITADQNTKYVIVQTTGKASDGSVQKISSVVNQLDNKCSTSEGGDITINGQKYKIDTEFKLNELLKDNENAALNIDSNKELLSQLPNILKHAVGNRTYSSGKYQILDVKTGNRGDKYVKGSNVTILPKPSNKSAHAVNISNCSVMSKQKTMYKQSEINNSLSMDLNKEPAQSSYASVSQQTTNAISKFKNTTPSVATKQSEATSSLPSISLRIQEQLRTSNASLKQLTVTSEKVLQTQTTASSTSNPGISAVPRNPTGPVKPIKLIQPPKPSSPLKRPMYGSPLNTPMPPKKQNIAASASTSRDVQASRLQIGGATKL